MHAVLEATPSVPDTDAVGGDLAAQGDIECGCGDQHLEKEVVSEVHFCVVYICKGPRAVPSGVLGESLGSCVYP